METLLLVALSAAFVGLTVSVIVFFKMAFSRNSKFL